MLDSFSVVKLNLYNILFSTFFTKLRRYFYQLFCQVEKTLNKHRAGMTALAVHPTGMVVVVVVVVNVVDVDVDVVVVVTFTIT